MSTPHLQVSRRAALKSLASGFGYLAFAGLASRSAVADTRGEPLAPKKPHFTAKAKHVIFLCMNGGPSHVDTFDHKPRLKADDGKEPPKGIGRGFAAAIVPLPERRDDVSVQRPYSSARASRVRSRTSRP